MSTLLQLGVGEILVMLGFAFGCNLVDTCAAYGIVVFYRVDKWARRLRDLTLSPVGYQRSSGYALFTMS
jgi:hypothetical protein